MKAGDRVEWSDAHGAEQIGDVVRVETAGVVARKLGGRSETFIPHAMAQVVAPTKVLFRKWPDGDVIAIFPEVDEGRGRVSSYLHVGQHSACARGVVERTRPATESEYAGLKAELESAPYWYFLKVVRRWPSR